MQDLHIKKLSGYVGAEISGISLQTIDQDTFTAIQHALYEHGVLFFREQFLTPEQHIEFAERWGNIDINRFFNAVDGYPKIAEVRTKPDQSIVIGGHWHTDHSFDSAPAMASILSAQQIPEYGGDTLFASQTAAYEHLSDGLKSTLQALNAWHSDASFGLAAQVLDEHFSADGITQPVLHPVIIRHPVTGQKAIYVNAAFTTHFEGWTVEESKPLLEYLYQYVVQPSFCCRFTWSPGAVAIWENRLVQHFAAADYQGQSRLMHRITIEGCCLNE